MKYKFMFIFDTKISLQVHMVQKTGAENECQKIQSIHGADFWSVSHAMGLT